MIKPLGSTILASLLVALAPAVAPAQLFNLVNLDRLNRRLEGHVDDYTRNHGADRRIVSRVLGEPRDMYVYRPPGYDPRRAYPLVLVFHTGDIDEHALLGPGGITALDRLIARGEFPPAIVACPDGTYEGRNSIRATHSLYVNGDGGRFEDHIIGEVIPFLTEHYTIRPERQAHAIVGASAGGYGGMGLAIKHRDFFGSVATIASPLNMRYGSTEGYRADFDPTTFRWNDMYNPDETVGIFTFGLQRVKAKKFLGPVYGSGSEVPARIAADNPADLITSTDLRPGELAIYVNYGGKDGWNFDAQDESFAALCQQKGIELTLVRVPKGRHNLKYFRTQQEPAYRWLAGHLTPPTPEIRVAH
jgi:S-formylglutathione hydrolase FrmB